MSMDAEVVVIQTIGRRFALSGRHLFPQREELAHRRIEPGQ